MHWSFPRHKLSLQIVDAPILQGGGRVDRWLTLQKAVQGIRRKGHLVVGEVSQTPGVIGIVFYEARMEDELPVPVASDFI